MADTKKIPCRVCGKPFKPCGYCQSHSEIFRWRNFACSMKCAQEYISSTTAYRDAKHKTDTSAVTPVKEDVTFEKEKPKKTYKKKYSEPIDISVDVMDDTARTDIKKETE